MFSLSSSVVRYQCLSASAPCACSSTGDVWAVILKSSAFLQMGGNWIEKYFHLICKGLRNEWLNPEILSYIFVVGFM
jgi:hypothetical protein